MTDSWWLKVKRAQHHMIEVRREARRYANSHPYEIVPVRQPKRQRNVGIYSLRITQQPDPVIAVILGDFVHNLRSALDHIVVASVPTQRRKIAGFRVLFEDIWEKDALGNFVVKDDERRKEFDTATKGLPLKAIALIKAAQPYQMADPSKSIIGILSRLENADKHRQLIAVGEGLEHPIFRISARGQAIDRPAPIPNQAFLVDGAEYKLTFPPAVPPISDAEVDVKCVGTAVITIRVTSVGGNRPLVDYRLYDTMLGCLHQVRLLLRMMKPYVIS